jgi:hypothetical protein
MNDLRKKAMIVAGATLGFAALLGGSLGFAAAGTRQNLGVGFNLVGGPLQANVAPDKFLSCLPEQSWTGLYIWDGANQKWLHFFNAAKGVPAYVNGANVGGITIVPRASGAALIMAQAVSNPQLVDSPNEACTS